MLLRIVKILSPTPKTTKILIVAIAITLIITIVAISVVMNRTSTETSSEASTATGCAGQLTIAVSLDNDSYSKSIAMTNDMARYYLKVTDSQGNPCSLNMETSYQYCKEDGQCEDKMELLWGNFRSDKTGVVRADVDPIVREGKHTASFRPAGSNAPFSNSITVQVVKDSPQLTVARTTIKADDYFIDNPGYAFEFTNINHVHKTTHRMRLQMEEVIDWGGYPNIPWRFTKNSPYSYWCPLIDGMEVCTTDKPDASMALRWMIVTRDYKYKDHPVFDKHVWATGSKVYYTRKNPATGMHDYKDIFPKDRYFDGNTISTTGRLPSYNLMPKQVTLPYIDFNTNASTGHNWKNKEATTVPEPVNTKIKPFGSWRVRMDMHPLKITPKNEGDYSFDGEALKVDYFESIGIGNPEEVPLLRETWWFVKGVGLVRIDQKNFNGFGADNKDTSIAKPCKDDPDCLNDVMQNPHNQDILRRYYHNPKLTISVSNDNITYKNSITIKKSDFETQKIGYYLKAVDKNNVGYTGYLEAKVPDYGVFKWLWAEDGVVQAETGPLKNLKPGSYKAQFRVWVPDDKYDNEKRITDTDIPWSKQTIEVVIL